jgi:hypothetical protein
MPVIPNSRAVWMNLVTTVEILSIHAEADIGCECAAITKAAKSAGLSTPAALDALDVLEKIVLYIPEDTGEQWGIHLRGP